MFLTLFSCYREKLHLLFGKQLTVLCSVSSNSGKFLVYFLVWSHWAVTNNPSPAKSNLTLTLTRPDLTQSVNGRCHLGLTISWQLCLRQYNSRPACYASIMIVPLYVLRITGMRHLLTFLILSGHEWRLLLPLSLLSCLGFLPPPHVSQPSLEICSINRSLSCFYPGSTVKQRKWVALSGKKRWRPGICSGVIGIGRPTVHKSLQRQCS